MRAQRNDDLSRRMRLAVAALLRRQGSSDREETEMTELPDISRLVAGGGRTAAQLLVRCLRENGIRRAWGVPGESFLDILDAMPGSGVDFVTCRHEGGAAMAAAAHGQLTGEVGLCMVTRGPGATNASVGLHAARQGGLPMLLLIGQVPRCQRSRMSFQEIDCRRAFSALVKWADEIDDADRIPEFVARAVTVARSGTPGPVVLALPEDMLADVAKSAPRIAPRIHAAAPAAASETARILRRSGRPLILAGGSAWGAAASCGLGKFAQEICAPVAFAFRAQDILDNDHPSVVGPAGLGGDRMLADCLQEADVLLLLGARIGSGTSVVEEELLEPPPGQVRIQVHPDPDELARAGAPDLAVQADARAFAEDLGRLPPEGTDSEEREAWRRRWRKRYEAFSRPVEGASGYLGEVVLALRERLSDTAIVTNCAGNFAIWLHRHFRYRGPGTGLAPVAGIMGFGLPAALAAAMAHPDRQVVAWMGDGSMMMNGQELATAVQVGARFTVIVGDNGSLATIRMHQERRFPGRPVGTDIRPPDFVAWARSFGAHAERADDLESFRSALDRCLACEGPSLLHLPMDPRVLAPGLVLAG